VIVNPAHVLGPGDPGRSSNSLVKRFLRQQIPAYVDGTLNVVGAEDVARGHLLASLVATGLIAALFAPLRLRVQRAVNRLLYGLIGPFAAAIWEPRDRTLTLARDPLGRPLGAGHALVYDYLDTSHTFAAQLLSDAKALASPDRETLMGVLGGAYVAVGPRAEHRAKSLAREILRRRVATLSGREHWRVLVGRPRWLCVVIMFILRCSKAGSFVVA